MSNPLADVSTQDLLNEIASRHDIYNCCGVVTSIWTIEDIRGAIEDDLLDAGFPEEKINEISGKMLNECSGDLLDYLAAKGNEFISLYCENKKAMLMEKSIDNNPSP